MTPHASSELIVHKADPLNAEPPLDRLRAAFITPIERFYIRTHGEIPELDGTAHRLRVEGLVSAPLELSMDELRTRFPRRAVTATLQCAGNRRAELNEVAPVSGTKWDAGAIGTAEWAGVALADVLRAAGLWEEETRDLHVAFACADEVRKEGRRFTFGASIPLAKALGPEVLLADEMNGRPLAPEHGFPLRVVVPGYVGVRSAKWLVGVRVQDQPSDNFYQQTEYRLEGATLYEFPLNAAICEPAHDAALPHGPTVVRGYAVAAARAVERVEISADGGQTWTHAETETRGTEPWAWTLWTARLDLPPGEHELAVRAWDEAAQTQPKHLTEVWNPKGYVDSAWHRIRVRVD